MSGAVVGWLGCIAALLAGCLGALSGCGGKGRPATQDGALTDAGASVDSAQCPTADAASCAGEWPPLTAPAAASLQVPFEVKWAYVEPQGTGLFNVVVLPSAQKVVFRQGTSVIVLMGLDGGNIRRFGPVAGADLGLNIAADARDDFYVAGEQQIYSYSASGTLRWTTDLPGPFPAVSGSPGMAGFAIRGGTLYAGATDRRLHAIDTTDGRERWSIPLAIEASLTHPVGRGDTLFVPVLGGGLVAVDATSGAVRWQAPCPHLIAPNIPMPTRSMVLGGSYDFGGVIPKEETRVFALGKCDELTTPVSLRGNPDWSLETRSGAVLARVEQRNHAVVDFALIDLASNRELARRTIGVDDGVQRTFAAYVVAIGDDDVAYIVETYVPIGAPGEASRLHRLSLPSLASVGPPLEIGEGATIGYASAMTDEGLLIVPLARRVVAVQTPSPGPLKGAWSLSHGDARASKWLEP